MKEYAARRWLSPSLGTSLPAGGLLAAVVDNSVIKTGTAMIESSNTLFGLNPTLVGWIGALCLLAVIRWLRGK
jgi:hypothetical protein